MLPSRLLQRESYNSLLNLNGFLWTDVFLYRNIKLFFLFLCLQNILPGSVICHVVIWAGLLGNGEKCVHTT